MVTEAEARKWEKGRADPDTLRILVATDNHAGYMVSNRPPLRHGGGRDLSRGSGTPGQRSEGLSALQTFPQAVIGCGNGMAVDRSSAAVWGVQERDPVRGNDSYAALEEIFIRAKDFNVRATGAFVPVKCGTRSNSWTPGAGL